MTRCGDGMHCGINSSASVSVVRAHGKAQSCVCVCGLISKAPQDSSVALERVEIIRKSRELSNLTFEMFLSHNEFFFSPSAKYCDGNKNVF